MILTLQNLSFLRTLEDWRATLASGERTASSRLVPFTTANGSTVYRKATPSNTATVAQPKRTMKKFPATNLVASASPTNLQTAGLFGWIKSKFGKDTWNTPEVQEALAMDKMKFDKMTLDIKIKNAVEYDKIQAFKMNYRNTTWDPVTDARIKQLHPDMQKPVIQFINKVDFLTGVKLRITDHFRTFAEQDELYTQGRTKPGKVVTWAKGASSYHNYGLAIDVTAIARNQVDYNINWEQISGIAKRFDFTWGGDWPEGKKDKPHFQLDFGKTVSELYDEFIENGTVLGEVLTIDPGYE